MKSSRLKTFPSAEHAATCTGDYRSHIKLTTKAEPFKIFEVNLLRRESRFEV